MPVFWGVYMPARGMAIMRDYVSQTQRAELEILTPQCPVSKNLRLYLFCEPPFAANITIMILYLNAVGNIEWVSIV